jgi:hypothetical protein
MRRHGQVLRHHYLDQLLSSRNKLLTIDETAHPAKVSSKPKGQCSLNSLWRFRKAATRWLRSYVLIKLVPGVLCKEEWRIGSRALPFPFMWRDVSQDSAVGIATSWTTEGSEWQSRWGQEFLFLHLVQTCSGVHSTSYPMGTGALYPGVKRPGREADHSPPTSAEVKKMWIYTSTSPYVFMV